MQIRRVVTGHDIGGKSVFVSDEPVDPATLTLMPGTEFHQIWGSDGMVSLPTDGSHPAAPRYFPAADGFRFSVFTLGPAGAAAPEGIDIEAALAEFEERVPGLADALEPDNPGMHTTDTVDYDFVVSGEVYLELDDGAEVLLRAGDCVVQNGTRHRWTNRSDQPCTIVVAIVGASRA
jgi:mannose-6-phosphate isomerase-like protein (cupin superfamily)